jgi:hypothetical protein
MATHRSMSWRKLFQTLRLPRLPASGTSSASKASHQTPWLCGPGNAVHSRNNAPLVAGPAKKAKRPRLPDGESGFSAESHKGSVPSGMTERQLLRFLKVGHSR